MSDTITPSLNSSFKRKFIKIRNHNMVFKSFHEAFTTQLTEHVPILVSKTGPRLLSNRDQFKHCEQYYRGSVDFTDTEFSGHSHFLGSCFQAQVIICGGCGKGACSSDWLLRKTINITSFFYSLILHPNIISYAL